MKTSMFLVMAILAGMLFFACGSDDAGDARCDEFCSRAEELCEGNAIATEFLKSCRSDCNADIGEMSEAQIEGALACARAAESCEAGAMCVNME